MSAVADEEHLANELASLRIDRDRKRKGSSNRSGERRGVPGWAVALLLVPILAVGGYFVMREGRGRMFPDEVEVGTVALMSPQPEDVNLVASGYVYARKKATVAPKIAGAWPSCSSTKPIASRKASSWPSWRRPTHRRRSRKCAPTS